MLSETGRPNALRACATDRVSQADKLSVADCLHTDYSFLTPKNSAKFDRGHPVRGRQMQVCWVKIGDFRQITGYISKTVQDRRMVSIKVE